MLQTFRTDRFILYDDRKETALGFLKKMIWSKMHLKANTIHFQWRIREGDIITVSTFYRNIKTKILQLFLTQSIALLYMYLCIGKEILSQTFCIVKEIKPCVLLTWTSCLIVPTTIVNVHTSCITVTLSILSRSYNVAICSAIDIFAIAT